ncbi:MAG: aldo/keto reductase [Verrucomicrobiales bacterium]|nr:aldo/keto reductase [Verrucomicrobiota bacterium JB025]
MKPDPNCNTSRRRFLRTSVGIPATVTALAAGTGTAAAAPAKAKPRLPARKLGRNGPEVTMLNLGGMMAAHSPQYLDLAWNNGIRYFDTADCYIKGKSEQNIAKWLQRYPERRKELFLVDKDHPTKGPKQMLEQIDTRLKACGTDYFDLFFVHGLGSGYKGAVDWPKSDEFKAVCGQLKASGKARMVGFSCHDRQLIQIMHAAAEGGFVDAIMVKYNPFHEKGGAFDKAMDACHKAGIGIVAMKEMRPFAKAPKKNPAFDKLGITTHQAVLQAVWSDPRISSICSAMENVGQIEENCGAAMAYKAALPREQMNALQEVAMLQPAPMCPGCPGCEKWAGRTEFAFQDISRYVTYYEQDGSDEAAGFYRELAASQRTWDGVDLDAIRDECQYHVDYGQIAMRAERYFA